LLDVCLLFIVVVVVAATAAVIRMKKLDQFI